MPNEAENEEDQEPTPEWVIAAESKLTGEETTDEMLELYASAHKAELMDASKAEKRLFAAMKEERRAFEAAVDALDTRFLQSEVR